MLIINETQYIELRLARLRDEGLRFNYIENFPYTRALFQSELLQLKDEFILCKIFQADSFYYVNILLLMHIIDDIQFVEVGIAQLRDEGLRFTYNENLPRPHTRTLFQHEVLKIQDEFILCEISSLSNVELLYYVRINE